MRNCEYYVLYISESHCTQCRALKIPEDTFVTLFLFSYVFTATCPLPIGIESGKITDGLISASSFKDEDHRPQFGRLRNNSFWRPAEDNHGQWLQVSCKDPCSSTHLKVSEFFAVVYFPVVLQCNILRRDH